MEKPRWNLMNPGCGQGAINIFFAGSGFTYDFAYDFGVRKRLLSWHANAADEINEYVERQNGDRQSFGIVDSGAFTVWNKGGTIDVEDYGKRLVSLLQSFDIAANLDVIPGKKGMAARDITPAITEAAAMNGWRNYQRLCQILAANGIDIHRIMPIYHQGESITWLKKMVDVGCEYIGVSPSNDYTTSQRIHWLDDTFDYLRSLRKIPKTHGYAVTSERLMAEYPWFSVDSASWIMAGGYGSVWTPFGQITMSDRPQVMGRSDAMDGRDWSPEMKARAEKYFSDINVDVQKMRSTHEERWKANAIYLLNWEARYQFRPRPKPASLF